MPTRRTPPRRGSRSVAHDLVDDRLGQEAGEDVADAIALDLDEPALGEPRVDPGAQQRRIERLREVVLGARLDTAHDAVQLIDRRDHDHGDVAQAWVALDVLEHGEPVELRHQDVEQNHVRQGVGVEQPERHAAVLCSRPCAPPPRGCGSERSDSCARRRRRARRPSPGPPRGRSPGRAPGSPATPVATRLRPGRPSLSSSSASRAASSSSRDAAAGRRRPT